MDIYILNQSKKDMIDWSTFKELSDCFVSDYERHTVANGKYIRIDKDTNEVMFVNVEHAKQSWINSNVVDTVPLLIMI